jgi:hypothetical protein
VIPAGVNALTEDRRRVSVIAVMEGLREIEEFLRLDAADPDRDRGGVSAKAKMDRSNSGYQRGPRNIRWFIMTECRLTVDFLVDVLRFQGRD